VLRGSASQASREPPGKTYASPKKAAPGARSCMKTSISASPGSQAPARRQVRHGRARAGCPQPRRSRATLSSLPARKSYPKCADQPVAAKNRRLTRMTEHCTQVRVIETPMRSQERDERWSPPRDGVSAWTCTCGLSAVKREWPLFHHPARARIARPPQDHNSLRSKPTIPTTTGREGGSTDHSVSDLLHR
jgi:hypothetical protein